MTGINSVIGSYKIDKEKPYRQLISFERLRLEPGDKSPEGVKRWLAVTKSGNDTMVHSRLPLLALSERNLLPP